MQTLTLIAFYLVLAVSPMGSPVCDSIKESGKTAVREEPTPSLNTTAAEIYYFHPDHLGSSAWVTDTLGHAVQHLGYLPWGERYISQKTGNFSTIYTFSGKERDEETGYSYFGQRFYDSELSFWLSVDPMRGKYPNMSPFVYCANNPIKLVDPNGMEINPIYDLNGNFLGTDDKGLQGEAIIMNKSDFRQGMSHEEAMAKDMSFEQSVEFANSGNLEKFLKHYNSLSSRPDWDGYLTLSEANDWYREGNGQPLFVDATKIDISPLKITDFNEKTSFIKDFLESGNFETGLVYGKIKVTLLNQKGDVRLGYDGGLLDKYDFDYKKGFNNWKRNIKTFFGRIVAGKGTTFDIYNYGTSKIK